MAKKTALQQIHYLAYDRELLIIALVLMAIGLVMVASASMEVATNRYANPFYHFNRHAIYLCLGLSIAAVTLYVPMSLWQKFSGILLVLAVLLLIVVLIPGIGRTVNGSTRWISLPFFNVQPSELAKLFVVIYLASYLARHLDTVRTSWAGFIKPMIVIAVMIVLLLKEPDFGAVVVLIATAFGMMFLAGVRLFQFGVLVLCCTGAIVVVAMAFPDKLNHVLERVQCFRNPWEDPFGCGFQLVQALIAFGFGGLFGVGLGNSVQKQHYLPEAHTDFLFAIIGEELGMIGLLLVILLFCFLVSRALAVGRRAENIGLNFQAYLAYGITLLIAVQILINVGVNVGLLPTKGLTLPLVSYGGSSLLTSCMAIAILLRIDYETRNNARGLRPNIGPA